MKAKQVVLISGLPGSGKTSFAELLYNRLRNEGCGRLDGSEVRKDVLVGVNVTSHDLELHALSMGKLATMFLAHGLNQYLVIDCMLPTTHTVAAFKAIIRRTSYALTHIWMDTLSIDDCKYRDVAALWQAPHDMQFQVIGHHFPDEMKEAVTVVQQHLQFMHRGPYPVLL